MLAIAAGIIRTVAGSAGLKNTWDKSGSFSKEFFILYLGGDRKQLIILQTKHNFRAVIKV